MAYDADVLITGAGPAGCSAGIRLAEAGHSVLMIERDPMDAGPDITSGEVLALRTQIECANLGISLDEPWVFDRLRFVRNVYPDLSWTLHAIPEGAGHVHVDRGGFNAALRARAASAGARLACRQTAHGVSFRADGVEVRTREGRAFQGRLLIDASGRNSVALNALGLKDSEPEFQQIAVALFFTAFPDVEPGTWDRHLYGENGTMISGSRIREGLYRYIMEADLAGKRSEGLKPVEYYEQTARMFDPWLAVRLAAAPRASQPWAMAPLAYRARAVVQDRLILAGDAAGYLSPITGQGVEFAMRMGRLAAQATGEALRSGDVSAGGFAMYVEGQQAEIAGIVRMVRQQLRLFRDRDALLRAARDDAYRAQVLLPLPVVDRGTFAS